MARSSRTRRLLKRRRSFWILSLGTIVLLEIAAVLLLSVFVPVVDPDPAAYPYRLKVSPTAVSTPFQVTVPATRFTSTTDYAPLKLSEQQGRMSLYTFNLDLSNPYFRYRALPLLDRSQVSQLAVDLDGDRLDELPLGLPPDSQSEKSGLGQIGYIDSDDLLVILDSLQRPVDHKDIDDPWRLMLQAMHGPDEHMPLSSPDYAYLMVAGGGNHHGYRRLLVLKKGTPPEIIASVPMAAYYDFGQVHRNLRGQYRLTLGSFSPGNGLVLAPEAGQDATGQIDTLRDYGMNVAQFSERGELLWARSLFDGGGRSLVFKPAKPGSALVVVYIRENFLGNERPTVHILRLAENSGTILDSSSYTGFFHTFNGLAARDASVLGLLDNGEGRLRPLQRDGSLLGPLPLRLMPGTRSRRLPVLHHPEEGLVFAISMEGERSLLVNSAGDLLAAVEGHPSPQVLRFGHLQAPTDRLLIVRDQKWYVAQIHPHNSSLWWLWRARWSFLLIAIPPLVLGFGYALRYSRLSKRSRGALLRNYRRASRRWRTRADELSREKQELLNRLNLLSDHPDVHGAAPDLLVHTLDVLEDGLFDNRLDTDHVYYSPGYCRILGYNPGELPSRHSSFEERIHPDDQAELNRRIEEHVEGRSEVFAMDHRIRHRDGRYIWVASRARIIQRDEEGKPVRVVGYMRDNHQQKRLEADLQSSRNQLNAIVNNVPDAIFMVNDKLVLLHCNAAVQRLLGWDPDKATGRLAQTQLPATAKGLLEEMQFALQHPGVREGYDEWQSAGGRTRVIKYRISRMNDPLHGQQQLMVVLSDESRMRQLEQEARGGDRRHGMIGASEAMRRVWKTIDQIGGALSPVLLLGPSGTGKNLAARALHDVSPHADGPFLTVSCAALSESLLESELFGHVRGAFTGAHRDRIGRFEAARDGTIFLDEVGEMSLAVQVKLLRVLQEGEFEAVGDSQPRKSNARIIAATNLDIAARVGEGLFREDLYYRLNVFSIELPPLRQRPGDIPLLAEHFRALYARQFELPVEQISGEALERLLRHDWPGNARELENIMQRAVVLCREGNIKIEHLPPNLQKASSARVPAPGADGAGEDLGSGQEGTEPLTREQLLIALDETSWNVAAAARRLGLSRNTLYTHIKQHGLKRPQ